MKKFQIAVILSILLTMTACSSKEKETAQTIQAQAATESGDTTVASVEDPINASPTIKPFELATQSSAYYLSPKDREIIEKNTDKLKDVPKAIEPWIMRGAKPYLLTGDPTASSGYAIRYLSSKDYDETIAFLQKNIVKEGLQDASLISEVSGNGLSTWSYAGFMSDGNVIHLLISSKKGEDINVYIIVDPPQ